VDRKKKSGLKNKENIKSETKKISFNCGTYKDLHKAEKNIYVFSCLL
jgi:hypothetical protein